MLFSHVRADGRALFHYPHQAHSVRVTGSFSGWSAEGHALDRTAYGFVGEVGPVPHGDVEYKLIVDGRWVADPQNLSRRPDGFGGEKSVIHRGGGQGSVHHLDLHSAALGDKRGYVVYLPPGHAEGRRSPVLYLLHGALDWERTWVDKGDLTGAMDHLRHEGSVGEMIVVMPRDNGELFHGDGRYVDYLTRDLVGHIDHEFPTLADARHRAIDGLSTGGFTSIVLGAWRTPLFRSVGSMSGCHDHRSFEAIRDHAHLMRGVGQRYRISWGNGEPHLGTCRAVAEDLARAGVHAEQSEGHGGHDWPLWRGALAGHLRFHWNNIRP